MYAALCQTYSPRDPLQEFAHGSIDLNTLRILVEHLPPDSAAHRAEPSSRGWTTDTHLAALLVDAVQALFTLTKAINSDGQYEPPEPIDRPGSTEAREAMEREEQAAAEAALPWLHNIESILLPKG